MRNVSGNHGENLLLICITNRESVVAYRRRGKSARFWTVRKYPCLDG
jgi:hypothetical protein